MIYPRKSFVVLVFAVVLFSGSAHAQENKLKTEDAETAALREKAFKLLDSVAGQLTTLQSAENRARMGANLVDSLWKHDEDRARSLLRLVQEDIRTELQKQEKGVPEDPTFMVFLKLRYDTVERLLKYDAEVALQFFKVTEPFANNRAPYDFDERERSVELRLARQIAANNPAAALKLGRQALEKGLSYDLFVLLGKLNRKHRDSAQILYKEIVEKLTDTEPPDYSNDNHLAQVLAQSFQPPDADESVYRNLISMFVSRALAHGCENKFSDDDSRSSYCRWAMATVPNMEKFDPRAARLNHWKPEFYEQHGNSVAWTEIDELLEKGTLDELQEAVSKYPGLQEMAYARALYAAKTSGRFEQARTIITHHFADPNKQKELLDELDTWQRKPSINEETLANLEAELAETPQPWGRVVVLLRNACRLSEGDRKVSLKLIDRASEIAETLKPGKEQIEARLASALSYSHVKSDRGFTIMESLVPKLNELVETAAKLDGYETNYLRDGEWNMSASGNVGNVLTILAQQAGLFAWLDFDRAVSFASQFERPEIRMMAHLKLAQSILAGPLTRPFCRY